MENIKTESLHTTNLGEMRIRRNLGLGAVDVVALVRAAIKNAPDAYVYRKGKNLYVHTNGCIFTINASSNTIITAHKTSDA